MIMEVSWQYFIWLLRFFLDEAFQLSADFIGGDQSWDKDADILWFCPGTCAGVQLMSSNGVIVT